MRVLRRLPRAQKRRWKNNLRIGRRKALRGPLARPLEGFCFVGRVTVRRPLERGPVGLSDALSSLKNWMQKAAVTTIFSNS